MVWRRKDLLGLEDFSREEIEQVLDTARSFREVLARPIKKVPTLRGKSIVSLFCEPSTRTRTSFELAAKRLSADTVHLAVVTSSAQKGESLRDMARNIEAMRVDMIVIRHPAAGAAHLLAECVQSSVVNAGDGAHEHPTQALVDLLTILDRRPAIDGLKVSIIGDIAHSRVARSNLWGLTKLGAQVTLCGPPTLIPPGIEQLGVRVTYRLDEALAEADVLSLLRIQQERLAGPYLPSVREYAATFGITRERLARAKPDALILHPGPVTWGVELTPDVAAGPHALILDQVTNGVAVRMAVLFLLLHAKERAPWRG